MSAAVQCVFPGMESFVPEPKPKKLVQWKPKPGTLTRVKVYFEGYAANGRDIYARRKHIAAKLGIGVRTLARYLAYLAAIGWIETAWRTARTAFRKLLAFPIPKPSSGPSPGPSIEVKPPRTKVLQEQFFTPSVIWVYPSNHARELKPSDETPLLPEGLGFEAYRHLRQKLRDSLPWIEKALNRRAYEKSIVKRELIEMGLR